MGIANKPDTKVFSSDEMQNYLEDFDVIGQKYFYWLDKQTVDKSELDDLKDRIFRRWHQNDMIDRYSVENAIDTYQTLEKALSEMQTNKTLQIEAKVPSVDMTGCSVPNILDLNGECIWNIRRRRKIILIIEIIIFIRLEICMRCL